MEELMNKIHIVDSGIGTYMLEYLEVDCACGNMMEHQYGLRDILRIVNDGVMYSDTFRLERVEIGGGDFGRTMRCRMDVTYFDGKERVINLYYQGDGMFYAYAKLDNGEMLHALFDDHNWRVENESAILHDMMAAFVKEFDKYNK